MLSGWGMTGLSFIPWALATGADKGATLCVMAFMLAGTAVVLRAGFRHEGRTPRKREPRENGNGALLSARQLLARRVAVFLLAGPVSGAVAMLATANVFAWWNVETGSAANRLAVTLLMMPFAWALLATLATYDVPLRRRSVFVFGFAAAGVAGLMLSPGMM